MKRLLSQAVGIGMLALACGESPRVSSADETHRLAEDSQSIHRFVAFRQRALTLDRLESPTLPPVTVGSTVSQDLLSSSAPEVVGIDHAGNLVGHKNGEALVRGSGASVLVVRVRANRTLRIVPSRLELEPGRRAEIRALGDSTEVPVDVLRWETTDPGIASATGTTIQAGVMPGVAILSARSGDAEAMVTVDVRVRASPPIVIVAPLSAMHVGTVQQLRVDSKPGIPILWSSSDISVLQPLRDGVFFARAPGKVQACATVLNRRACERVRVIR